MTPPTIWVDADAAPGDVKEILFRAARRLELRTVMVANHRISVPANTDRVEMVLVRHGPDVADHYIVANAKADDVAVTADIPLAAELVGKGLVVLDPRGERYTEANVRERLSIRDFMDSLRGTGVETGGPAAFGAKEKRAFADALDRTLTARLKRTAPRRPDAAR